jgi:hypothetical protein
VRGCQAASNGIGINHRRAARLQHLANGTFAAANAARQPDAKCV